MNSTHAGDAFESDGVPLLTRSDATVYHATYEELAPIAAYRGRPDLLLVDAPYSDRTHSASAELEALDRSPLSYEAWTPTTVAHFVHTWEPLTLGWFCTLTDHILAPYWAGQLEACGRYVFSPIACTVPGSRVRLQGDGPAQWSVWLVVARPRTAPWSCWGALPGAYVVPRHYRQNEPEAVPGAKPLWLVEQIVRDYSREGELVCDPCCGGGTTPVAAAYNDRRSLSGDAILEHAQRTADALGRIARAPLTEGPYR